MRDYNGRTGQIKNGKTVRQYKEDVINNNGERQISLCEQHNLKINNGFFQHKEA